MGSSKSDRYTDVLETSSIVKGTTSIYSESSEQMRAQGEFGQPMARSNGCLALKL